MKKSELRTIVREIVREEVAMAIHEVITELKEPTVERKPIVKKQSKKKLVEKKHFTSNSVLNDVLNETANGDSDWETMGGTQYTSERMNELIGGQYKDILNGGTNNVPLPQTDTEGRPVDTNHISDDLMNNLTKDYSQTLKAMEKASDKTRGI